MPFAIAEATISATSAQPHGVGLILDQTELTHSPENGLSSPLYLQSVSPRLVTN